MNRYLNDILILFDEYSRKILPYLAIYFINPEDLQIAKYLLNNQNSIIAERVIS